MTLYAGMEIERLDHFCIVVAWCECCTKSSERNVHTPGARGNVWKANGLFPAE